MLAFLDREAQRTYAIIGEADFFAFKCVAGWCDQVNRIALDKWTRFASFQPGA